MTRILNSFGFILIFTACSGQVNDGSLISKFQDTLNEERVTLNENELVLKNRFNPPNGFSRTNESQTSFASYLRKLPLKPHGSKVKLYNGSTKQNHNVYEAVVDLPIGNKDLHQCADAVMRLRAEYLYSQNREDEIHFNFTNGFRVDYSKWKEGYRIQVNGNNVSWIKKAQVDNFKESFWKYLETIFMYAGTLSLSKELKPVSVDSMQIGDVFIRGGSPGHAVIVVDMVEDNSNNKLFLLAQSYMPAQEIQILKNPNTNEFGSWYRLKKDEELITPEWEFVSTDLKRFVE